MLAGYEHAPRGSTHGHSAVKLREAQAVAGERVDVRRLDFLLPVAAQFGKAQIVGHDQHDVRRTGGIGRLSLCKAPRDVKHGDRNQQE